MANCPEVITRTYQIADHCGNLATATHLITIDDNVNLTLTAPASLTAVCDILLLNSPLILRHMLSSPLLAVRLATTAVLTGFLHPVE